MIGGDGSLQRASLIKESSRRALQGTLWFIIARYYHCTVLSLHGIIIVLRGEKLPRTVCRAVLAVLC